MKSLLILSSFFKEAASRWKEEGYEREDPHFDKSKYDEYLEDKTKAKDFIKSQKDLFKHIDDPNVFITYTKNPILSTNYSSYFGSKKKYNTPAGFYSYPIIELKDKTADFAKDYPYIMATRFHGNLLVSYKYTREQLEKDLNKLRVDFPEINNYDVDDAKIKTPPGILYFYIWKLSEKNFSRFSTLFLKLGYQGFYDVGEGIIFPEEPRQAVFFAPKTSLEIIGIYANIDLKYEESHKFKKYKELTEEEKIEIILDDPEDIKYMHDPSEKLQLTAVLKYPRSVSWLQNPTQKVILTAIKENPYLIKIIKGITEEIKFLALKDNYKVIEYIDNPSEKLELFAVKQNYKALSSFLYPSEKIQLEAVRADYRAIEYIHRPSERIQLEAVKQNEKALDLIDNPSKRVIDYVNNLY